MDWEDFRDCYCMFCDKSCHCSNFEDAFESECGTYLSVKAKEFAKKWLSKKKYEHSCRVANYVLELLHNRYQSLSEGKCLMLAFLHDVVEDSDCSLSEIEKEFGFYIMMGVKVLTHNKEEMSYPAYIDKIMDSRYREAVVVKHADMKDHLAQKETLTPKLKEKYFEVIDRFI